MTKDRKYSFRDPQGLLEKLDQGSRSHFIREAVESKIRTSKSTYPIELEETRELMNFYTTKLETYDEQLIELEKEKEGLEQYRNNTQYKLDKIRKTHNMRKQILRKQSELEKMEQQINTRIRIFNEIIKNKLAQRENNTDTTINMEYLKIKGNYESINELELDLKEYVKGLQEYDTIQGIQIFKNDIEYLKKIT